MEMEITMYQGWYFLRTIIRWIAKSCHLFKLCYVHNFYYERAEHSWFTPLVCNVRTAGLYLIGCFVSLFQVVPFGKGELNLDSPQAAALLVLAISISFSDEQLTCTVPPTVFSYTIPLWGRISRSLKDVIHRDLLLVHLCNRSGMPFQAKTSKSKDAELLPCVVEEGISSDTKGTLRSSSWLVRCNTSEISFQGNWFFLNSTSTSHEEFSPRDNYLEENAIQLIKIVFKTVTEIWLLIQSQRTCQAQRMLRSNFFPLYFQLYSPSFSFIYRNLCYIRSHIS